MYVRKTMEIVSSSPAVIFSNSDYPYCVSVKKLLTKLGASYRCIQLDSERELQTAPAEWTGQRTVPNVFIGDCDAMHYGSKLLPCVDAAGAIKYAS